MACVWRNGYLEEPVNVGWRQYIVQQLYLLSKPLLDGVRRRGKGWAGIIREGEKVKAESELSTALARAKGCVVLQSPWFLLD
jgi:hypothetical protein